MRFREHQDAAAAATRRLLLLFAALTLLLLAAVNLALALLWGALTLGALRYPPLFFETNSGIVLLFVLGGCLVETWRLRDGGGDYVAQWVGGRALLEPRGPAERRLANVVDEMALASGTPRPALYVLERECAINAFVAGWGEQQAVLAVTRGALECLTRDELQGLVAHEFGHLRAGDLRLQMRLIALVWGLSLVHGWGRSLLEADELGRRSLPGVLVGAVFLALGWIGWLAGCALQAAVSRQREYAADASAVQFTRSRDGLGGTLRKIWFQSEREGGRLLHPRAEVLAGMLLHMPAPLGAQRAGGAGWLASHPPLAERVHRVYGREQGPLAATALDLVTESAPVDSAATKREHGAHAAQPLAVASMATMPHPDLAMNPSPPPARDEPQEPAVSPAALQRASVGQDELDALARLRLLHGPGERRAALLALILTPGSAREQQSWAEETAGVASAARARADACRLGPATRLPALELLLERSRSAPVAERQGLVEAARRVMSADGQVRPIDRLHWLAMRHSLGDAHVAPASARAPDNDIAQLPLAMVGHVAAMTAFLARLVPASDAGAAVGATGHAWYETVMAHWAARYREAGMSVPPCRPPDADALVHALRGLQEMSWMLRPLLLKLWVDAAAPAAEALGAEAADALRLAALLLDAPLPPLLARRYLAIDPA